LIKHWVKRFIHDSFGNIPGRGTHAAVRRLASWTRKSDLTYALQMDVAKYFCSVQHAYLKQMLLNREGDQTIRQLLVDVIESFQMGTEFDHLFTEESLYRQTIEKGMPLGNLTSQIFANIYLNEFDHWVKGELRVKHYIRYVDDLVFLGSSVEELNEIKEAVLNKLQLIGLTINPKKIAVRKINNGIPFLGYIIWKNHISAGKYVRNRYGKALRHSEGKSTQLIFCSYRGILKHTGATR